MSDPTDRQEARTRLAATIVRRLRLATLGGIAIGVVSLAFNWLVYPDHAALLSIGSVTIGGASLVTYLATSRGRLGPTAAHVVGTLIWGLAVIQSALGFVVDGSVAYTLVAILLMAVFGLLQVSRRWTIGGIAFLLVGWLPLGFALHGVGFAVYALALIGSGIAAVVVHEMIVGFLLDLDVLRLRDGARGTELAMALEQARHELAERQRVEGERERLREQLQHAQKMEAIGTLAGGVAHDMNNVLATVISLAELLREDVSGETSSTIGEILEVSHRGADLMRNLLGFSRRGQYRKSALALRSIVESVTSLLTRTLPKRIRIELEVAGDPGVEGDAAQLGQALMNLCLNASDAITGDGWIRIVVESVDLEEPMASAFGVSPGGYAALRVSDNGAGISRELQGRIFEPFFTTKAPGSGTGLGLAMVYGTLQAHGGAVSVDSEPGRGTTMTLLLPAIIASAPPLTDRVSPRAVATGSILVVDDEAKLRAATVRRLERAGYDVAAAANGAEALAVLDARGAPFDLVLLDMAMPVMGGAECFAELKRRDPGVKVLIVSGYAIEDEAKACLDGGALGFLDKPFTPRRLLDAIEQAIRGERVDGALEADGASSAERAASLTLRR